MAENGFVEKALGEADDGGVAEGAAPTADPIALAVAIDQARYDPELSRHAAGYLEDQRALVRLQLRHFDEERRLAIEAARRKRYADRIRNTLATLAAVAVAALLVTFGAMAWTASREHGLAIDAFSVPPDLARDGLTGQVVAARFLDRLQALQAATRSERPAASYQNNWGADIKVEIPETGLTFGDFERLLRDRLGHENHVTGEVIRTPMGLTLTARLGEEAPQTFAGAQTELDAMTQKAAEAVYRTSQPYRYAQYLAQHGRLPEAVAVAADLAASGPAGERAWAYGSLANFSLALGDLAAARRAVDAGQAAGGDGAYAVNIALATLDTWSGHDEALLDISRRADRGAVQKRIASVTEAAFEANRLISGAYLAGQTGAYASAAADYETLAGSGLWGATPAFYYAQASWARALNHDIAWATADLAKAGPLDPAFYGHAARSGYYAPPAYELAASRGDWPAALAELRKVDAMIEAAKAAQPALGLMLPVLVRPLEARALARTGQAAAAAALIATTPLDCYLCLRVRGEVAAAMKDWAGADRWYAEAVRQGPLIPFAYEEWGRARLARGDNAGAIADFRAAHRLEARFADALADWGDALAAGGQWGPAREKYDAALRLAPAWDELRRASAVAARRAG
jgi:hypothetical protein